MRKHRDDDDAMSTKLTRGAIRKTPRYVNKIDKTKSINEHESIYYDYNDALSQPDLTSFFKKETKTPKEEPVPEKQDPQNLQPKPEVQKIIEELPTTRKTVSKITESTQSLCSKNAIEKKKSNKLNSQKCPKSSRIPRAKFIAFSRMPVRCKVKKSSMTKVAVKTSKSGMLVKVTDVAKSLQG